MSSSIPKSPAQIIRDVLTERTVLSPDAVAFVTEAMLEVFEEHEIDLVWKRIDSEIAVEIGAETD